MRNSDLSLAVAYSEELGKIEIFDKGLYSAIFDDLDGSINYKYGLGMLPHGSIIWILEFQIQNLMIAMYLKF